jgi:hypothetical protein
MGLVYIDNTFSRNTPKFLTYSVALGEEVQVSSKKDEVSGWLLKKKRKRMQGWAKRWFSLSSSGVLSYSASQGSVTRGSIQILVATISYNPKLRQIHIDSGTMIYHLKTLTESDYDLWCTALRDIRTNVLDEEQTLMQEEHSNKSNVSLANSGKRLSSRALGGLQVDNKKMRAEIDHGIESAKIQQQNIDLLLQSIEELKQLAVPSNSAKELFERLELQKLQVLSAVQGQISQWQNVQNCLGSHRRSGSVSPIINNAQQTATEGTIPEYNDEEGLHRTSSIYSYVSDYSADQFYDAPEDIDLSGGEEEEEEEDIDDDEESSGSGEDDDRGKKLFIATSKLNL